MIHVPPFGSLSPCSPPHFRTRGRARAALAAARPVSLRAMGLARHRGARVLAGLLLFPLLLTGCLVGPNYQRPPLKVPEQYYEDKARAEANAFANLAWWQVFKDPLLNSLVDEALANGFDARIAVERVEEARARYGIARSRF